MCPKQVSAYGVDARPVPFRETRPDGFDERLRNVEIPFAKVARRRLTVERIVLPSRHPVPFPPPRR